MRHQILADLGVTARRTVVDGRGNRVPQAEDAVNELLGESYVPPSTALRDIIPLLKARTPLGSDPDFPIRHGFEIGPLIGRPRA